MRYRKRNIPVNSWPKTPPLWIISRGVNSFFECPPTCLEVRLVKRFDSSVWSTKRGFKAFGWWRGPWSELFGGLAVLLATGLLRPLLPRARLSWMNFSTSYAAMPMQYAYQISPPASWDPLLLLLLLNYVDRRERHGSALHVVRIRCKNCRNSILFSSLSVLARFAATEPTMTLAMYTFVKEPISEVESGVGWWGKGGWEWWEWDRWWEANDDEIDRLE